MYWCETRLKPCHCCTKHTIRWTLPWTLNEVRLCVDICGLGGLTEHTCTPAISASLQSTCVAYRYIAKMHNSLILMLWQAWRVTHITKGIPLVIKHVVMEGWPVATANTWRRLQRELYPLERGWKEHWHVHANWHTPKHYGLRVELIANWTLEMLLLFSLVLHSILRRIYTYQRLHTYKSRGRVCILLSAYCIASCIYCVSEHRPRKWARRKQVLVYVLRVCD